jgi:monoamine oxidase
MQYRREFLGSSGLSVAGCLTIPSLLGATNISPSADKKRVIVIGAGIAGLAAARKLQSNNCEVVVLEARERIGGRIWTSDKWKETPLDLGASWIHGVEKNPLTELADQIEADRVATSYDRSIIYNTSGKPLTSKEEKQLRELQKKISKAISKAQESDTDISIRKAIEPITGSFEESSEEHRFINFLLNGEIEQEYAGSSEKLSAHWYESEEGFEGDDALFTLGFATITESLAKGLYIELGHVVKEIQWHQPLLRVITQKSEFVADCLVVTVPLGVLQAKRVRFVPELPEAKLLAISKLGMGVLNKCYLRFETAFWPKDVDWIEYISEKPGEWTEWVSFMRTSDAPVLLGFNAADQGKKIDQWTDQQIVASAMQTLKTMFGDDIPVPKDYQLTRWSLDPFSMGSYSFNAVGSTPDSRKTLAEPVQEKLFFAGEATELDFFGTTHGAYLSGLRAADEVLEI